MPGHGRIIFVLLVGVNFCYRLVYFCFRCCGDFSEYPELSHVEFFAGKQAVTNAFLARLVAAIPFEITNDKASIKVQPMVASTKTWQANQTLRCFECGNGVGLVSGLIGKMV
jgi:hypothetical protein